ncbi:hypothetical protein ACFL5H_02935 [Candidatus Latescibacterota bacterium]
MEKEWMDSEDELSVEQADQQGEEESPEVMESLEINVAVISDTLQRLCEKSLRHEKTNRDNTDLFDDIGTSAKKFVLDNVTYIGYRDIARLIGMKPDALKNALGTRGIKVPLAGTHPWKKIDVGTFTALEECAKCPVQAQHSIFSVGINNCRKCIEENIKTWIEEGEIIKLMFGIEE